MIQPLQADYLPWDLRLGALSREPRTAATKEGLRIQEEEGVTQRGLSESEDSRLMFYFAIFQLPASGKLWHL